MTRYIWSLRLILLVTCLSLTSLARLPVTAVVSGEGLQENRIRIAVMNFENNSTWHYWGDNLGAAAADELVTQMFQTGEFSLVERSQIEAVLAEQDFGQSGRVTPSQAAEIGKVLGVQLILTGSITKFSIDKKGGSFAGIGATYSEAESNVDVRLIDANTAEIMFADDGEGKIRLGGVSIRGANLQRDFDAGLAQEALRPAVENIVAKIADQSDRFASIKAPVAAAQIVGSNAGSFYVDKGENYNVTVGQRYEVHRVIDEIKDAAGNVLDRITETVGLLEVTRVLGQSSIATVAEGEAAEGDTLVPIER
jgi:curli biogenesis system outer membrane secretion channel CsgG